ncbi:MAG: alpha/beta fold hydrolase [Proteobacteria bacterium]|nr:alpha/beta fold hydrolase [Pseudomonadota bacterium]
MPEEETLGRTPGGTTYQVTGRGEPVVLIHGVGMQFGVWAPQIAALQHTHQVIAYDMLGHGTSRLPSPGADLGEFAQQLDELLGHLGVPAANVAGHSMGALVALEFALRQPGKVLRVAALNAVFQRTPEQRDAVVQRARTLHEVGVAATIDSTIQRWFDHPVPTQLQPMAAQIAGYLRTVQPAGYSRAYEIFAQSDRVHAGRLHRLSMPTLFLTGEHDANSSPEMSRAMAREVAHAHTEVIAGARHMMNVTTPQAVNASLERWLAHPIAYR